MGVVCGLSTCLVVECCTEGLRHFPCKVNLPCSRDVCDRYLDGQGAPYDWLQALHRDCVALLISVRCSDLFLLLLGRKLCQDGLGSLLHRLVEAVGQVKRFRLAGTSCCSASC